MAARRLFKAYLRGDNTFIIESFSGATKEV